MTTIKNTIGVFLFCLFITSCGKDEENALIGTWVLDSLETASCNEPSFNNIDNGYADSACTDVLNLDCYYQEFVITETQITTNTTYVGSGEIVNETDPRTIMDQDNDSLLICPDSGSCTPASFTLNGDILVISIENGLGSCTVIMSCHKE